MRKVFFKILKEDASQEDQNTLNKERLTPYIIAGDSIAAGMVNSRKELRSGIHPAVKGSMASQWILDNLKAQLQDLEKTKDKSWFESASLIIIAGTNDGHGAGMAGNPQYFVNRAVENIKEMLKEARQRGIGKVSVMRLAVFDRDPNSQAMKNLVYDRKNNRGKKDSSGKIIRNPDGTPKYPWMKQSRTAEDWIRDHRKFVDDFNSQLESLGVPLFDMVNRNGGRVHAASRAESSRLFDNARAALGEISSIPINAIPMTPDSLVTSPEKMCSVNQHCRCVDRLVSDKITLKGVQIALEKLGIDIKITNKCDNQTRKAIQTFQKQQQELGFDPPDGREFLRCDACVGVNTLAALKAELAKKGLKVEDLLSPEERKAEFSKRRIRMSYTKGNIEDLQTFNETPLKGDALEFIGSHKFSDGITKEYTIRYSLRGQKQRNVAKLLLDGLKNIGITNPYLIMGILGCTGKESGFRIIFEGAGYGFKRIKEKRGAVPRRVWNIFKKQGFGAPKDRHIRAISGGGRNGIALFNIAYGYSKNQADKRITMPVLKDGEINPALYDENLAGWKYRGTGPIQATFRSTHLAVARTLNMRYEEIWQKLNDPSQAMPMAILMSCGYMKRTYPTALRKYGKEPTTIQEGLEWAQNCVGGLGFANPARPDAALHKGFLNAIPWLKNNFRLEIKDKEEYANV